jgi:hypothetical protein
MIPMQLHRTPEGKRQIQEWKPYVLQKIKNYYVQGERRNELKPCLMPPTKYQQQGSSTLGTVANGPSSTLVTPHKTTW